MQVIYNLTSLLSHSQEDNWRLLLPRSHVSVKLENEPQTVFFLHGPTQDISQFTYFWVTVFFFFQGQRVRLMFLLACLVEEIKRMSHERLINHV